MNEQIKYSINNFDNFFWSINASLTATNRVKNLCEIVVIVNEKKENNLENKTLTKRKMFHLHIQEKRILHVLDVRQVYTERIMNVSLNEKKIKIKKKQTVFLIE